MDWGVDRLVLIVYTCEHMAGTDLMQALTAIQHGAEWSDARMARELGISPAMWSFVKHGHRQPGSRVLGGIERRFPDLRPLVSLFLRSHSTTVN